MSLLVSFRREARAEFLEAAEWYEARRPDLGVEFVTEIERCVDLAAEQPLLYPVIHSEIRRVSAKRFPYGVYFRVAQSRIIVLAVFHVSRNPTGWRRRS